MQLLFCTKVQPRAQCKTVVVMQGVLTKKTYIHVYNIAQSLHNLMYVLRMCIWIMFCLLNYICQYLSVEIWNMVLSHKICSSLDLAIVFFLFCRFVSWPLTATNVTLKVVKHGNINILQMNCCALIVWLIPIAIYLKCCHTVFDQDKCWYIVPLCSGVFRTVL